MASSLLTGDHLQDTFRIARKYPERWVSKSKICNGDVTDPQDLVYLRKRILERYPHGVNLYTSDAGADVSQNFNQQETILSSMHLGQVWLGLSVTRAGGCLCIKQFTFFEPFTQSLISLLKHEFTSLYLYKPETSRPSNSELYLACEKYRRGFQSFNQGGVGETMLTLLQQCREKENRFPTQIRDPWILGFDSKLLPCLRRIAHTLVHRQIQALNEFLYLSNQYSMSQAIAGDRQKKIFAMMAREVCAKFLDKYDVQILDAKHWFARLRSEDSKVKRARRLHKRKRQERKHTNRAPRVHTRVHARVHAPAKSFRR